MLWGVTEDIFGVCSKGVLEFMAVEKLGFVEIHKNS